MAPNRKWFGYVITERYTFFVSKETTVRQSVNQMHEENNMKFM